jgi:hypothetical protein
MAAPMAGRHRAVTHADDWAWFLAWALVGAAWAFSLAAMLSFGILVLPVALLLTGLVATRRGAVHSVCGVLAGASVPAFLIGYLNRDGPGTTCVVTANSSSCTGHLAPLPFFLVGVVFLVGAVVGQLVVTRRRPPDHRSPQG